MPNIWTHMLFCEEVVDTIGNPGPFLKHETLMKLGAQGPDPFFYHKFWPWLKEGSVNDIGMLLHTKHCGPVLMDLIISAKNSNKPVQAYVFGFVTHHILDRNTHPYIHYRAGYEGSKHQKLEVLIDTIMMKNHHNLQTWKAAVYKEIDVGFSVDQEVVHLLHQTIKKHFPQIQFETPKYIQKAYRDMKLALRILSDPHGWKNAMLKSFVSSYSHQPITDDVDYLNINETTWHHPATNEPRTESFIDLYELAKLEGIEIMSEILKYWQEGNEQSEARIHELIANISYDTGTPLELNLTNIYCDPIV